MVLFNPATMSSVPIVSKVIVLSSPPTMTESHRPLTVKVFCDPKSYLFINGTEVDYLDDLLNGGFRFSNPNVSRSCGCGTSFAV